MASHSVLTQAVLLDTETLGLRRGAGIHELALLDLHKREVRGWVLKANAVQVQAAASQELTGLASAYRDQYIRRQPRSWMEAINMQLQEETGRRIALAETMKELRAHSPWLAKQLPQHPHLRTDLPDDRALRTARELRMKSFGYTATLGREATIQGLLGNELPEAIKGKTVWIANAAFEAKQLGAQLGAEGQEYATAWKSQFETFNPSSPDPFYVTGSEVTRSRVIAQQTGDWTGVWRAYKKYTPKAGETAVRDIQDVVRAVHSYGHKLGLTTGDLSYMGTSVEASHRMFALAEGDTARAGMKEFHRAAEDLALHEAYVLEQSVDMAEALQQVDEGTALGKQYRKLAAQGEGPLAWAARYFQALETHGPALMDEQLLKRLERGYQDIQTEGRTYQRVGDSTYKQTQQTPTGETEVYRMQARRRKFETMDELVQALDAEGRYSRYGASAAETWESMRGAAHDPQAMKALVSDRVDEIRGQWTTQIGGSSGRLRQASMSRVARAAGQTMLAAPPMGKHLAIAGGVLAFMGASASIFQRPEPTDPSIVSYGYREWAQHNQIEGMSQGPVASQQRHQMTDFGSPYRGPVGVQNVFMEQEMLAERERWLRAQYGARHYDPDFGAISPFQGFKFTSGNRFIGAGDQVRGEAYGLRGNLLALNLTEGGWKIHAEDADTVVVKRGGVRGALAGFFGLNRGYSFRLAGVDSPETSHGSGSYHAPQPGAENAANALRMILQGSEAITLVFDPSQTTYGRMMGAVVADGRNVNYQLVERGIAAHLPYGKHSESIINYSALKKAEARAYQNRRGIWATPWARAFYEHSEASGNRVTFNTLAKLDKIVENRGTMQMISMMEQVQRNAQFTERDTLVARELGASYQIGADRVEPWTMVAPSKPSHSYLTEQMADLAHFTRTRGRGHAQNKFSTRGNYGKLDQTMVLDTLGTSDNVWTKRRYGSFDVYDSGKMLGRARKERMAAQQRQALRAMQQSPIGHHRM